MLVFPISDKLASWEKTAQQQTLSDLSKADVVPAVEKDVASSSSFLAELSMDVASSPSSSQVEALLTDSTAPKEALPPTPVGFSPAASSPGRTPGGAAPKKGGGGEEEKQAKE